MAVEDTESRPAVGRDDGTPIPGPTGQPMIIKVAGTDTADRYSLIEYQHAAGAPGPPAHVHHEHEEAFLVLDGELTLQIDNHVTRVTAGGCVLVPRGSVHRPANTSAAPTRFVFVSSPAMDGFFVEMAQLMKRTSGKPASSELAAIGARWDTQYVDLPPVGVDMFEGDR